MLASNSFVFNLPWIVAGGLKIIYDLVLYRQFVGSSVGMSNGKGPSETELVQSAPEQTSDARDPLGGSSDHLRPEDELNLLIDEEDGVDSALDDGFGRNIRA